MRSWLARPTRTKSAILETIQRSGVAPFGQQNADVNETDMRTDYALSYKRSCPGEEAQQAGLVEMAGAAYVWVMDHGISARRYDLAAHAFESGMQYCSDHGLELGRHYLLAFQARWSLCRGQWRQAATMADSVLRIPRTSISPRIIALVVLASARARQGDPGHRNLLDEAQALAEPTRELERGGPWRRPEREVAWLARDAASAASATELAWHLPLESRPDMADELGGAAPTRRLGCRTAEEPRGERTLWS